MSGVRISDIKIILENAGYTDLELLMDGVHWEYWSAVYDGPSKRFHEFFLYLLGACSWSHLDNAIVSIAASRRDNELTVLVRNPKPRFDNNMERIKSVARTQTAITVPDFLYKTVRKSLGSHRGSMFSTEQPGVQYFIEPYVHLPTDNIEKAAISTLRNWLLGISSSDRNLAVLLAPAATGKSTFTLKLFENLVKQDTKAAVPLLITRDQWYAYTQQEELTFQEIWDSAVRELYPGAIVNIEQLERCLAFGTICPIFDGLDELCTCFPASFNPNDAIDELLSLLEQGDGLGRLLVTSRTKFWIENLNPAMRSKVMEIDLCPFTVEQRQRYIVRRFPDEPARQKKAQVILEKLVRHTTREVERGSESTGCDVPPDSKGVNWSLVPYERVDLLPYIVMLATESADTDKPNILHDFGHLLSPDDPLEGLIVHFCDRERERQKMTISATKQLNILQGLAVEFGNKFDMDAVRLVVDSQPGLRKHDPEQFRDHALLNSQGSQLSFRFAFISEYLMSRVVRTWLLENPDISGIQVVLEACVLGPGTLLEKCSELVRRASTEGWIEKAKSRWRSFPHKHRKQVQSGAFHVFLYLCKDDSKNIRKDATDALLYIMGDVDKRIFSNLYVAGDINGLDLRDVGFHNCHFEDLEFVYCKFDERTKFSKCRFDGRLLVDSCVDLGSAQLAEDCILSPLVECAFQVEQMGRRKIPITADQIREAVYDVLRKFVRGAMLRTRKKVGIRKTARAIPFGDALLEALERKQVLESFLNGSDHMYRISERARRDVHVFLVDKICTGRVKETQEMLFNILVP